MSLVWVHDTSQGWFTPSAYFLIKEHRWWNTCCRMSPFTPRTNFMAPEKKIGSDSLMWNLTSRKEGLVCVNLYSSRGVQHSDVSMDLSEELFMFVKLATKSEEEMFMLWDRDKLGLHWITVKALNSCHDSIWLHSGMLTISHMEMW